MITIYDSADMKRVLSGPIDPDLKTILLGRLELLADFSEWDLADLAHFIIVELHDFSSGLPRLLSLHEASFDNLMTFF